MTTEDVLKYKDATMQLYENREEEYMAFIKCPQCGKEISDKEVMCPGCGYKMQEISTPQKVCDECGSVVGDNDVICQVCGCQVKNNIQEKQKNSNKINKKIFGVAGAIVGVAIVALGIVYIVSNSNPVGKYQKLIQDGKNSEASTLYVEKIKGDKELKEELEKELVQKIDKIYNDFVSKSLAYDDAKGKIKFYEGNEVVGAYAKDTNKKLSELNSSRIAFEEAEKAENDGDVETAISKYANVIEDDEKYNAAQSKMTTLSDTWKKQLLDEAEALRGEKKYKEAISNVQKVISKLGSDDELVALKEQYEKEKNEQYAKIELTDKSVTPKNASNWIFSYYVNFVFDVKNNSDKDIQGIEGTATFCDLFGKEIITMGCDFTGYTIKAGETYTESDLSFECNEFMDDHMKLYNTDYADMVMKYEITKIVFSDGTTVVPN